MTGITLSRAELVPTFCEAIELSWHDEDAYSHCFAIPSAFPGLWHAGCCLRKVFEEDRFPVTTTPIPAAEVPAFFERNERRWAEGTLYRWPTNGLPENPLAQHSDYTARLFASIGK